MQIAIRPDLREFVSEKMKSGCHTDPSAVVNDALEVLRDQERLTPADIDEMRREIAIGLEQLDRGERVEFNAAEIKAEGRRILAARQRTARKPRKGRR
jgi:antitoxin ParD1/3/4